MRAGTDPARETAARLQLATASARRSREAKLSAEVDALLAASARMTAADKRRREAAARVADAQTAVDLYGVDALPPGFRIDRGGRVSPAPTYAAGALRLTRSQVDRLGREAAKAAAPEFPPGWFERTARAMYVAKHGRRPPTVARDYGASITTAA